MKNEQLWVWLWKNGGYNHCHAVTREEALEKARKMGETVLEVDEKTLHVGTFSEVCALDDKYASCCW